MGNPVTQWQIISRDPNKHSAFYASVFGWTISSDNPLGYRMADTGSGKGIPGGFWPAPPEATAFVQLFAEITNMDETIRKVTENGGSVLMPPQTLPAGEQMAILRDPFGLTFGVVVPNV
ncbi:MAG TPA: VOC family protein [Terriglobales bacterium]|jgi:hypothetical protein